MVKIEAVVRDNQYHSTNIGKNLDVTVLLLSDVRVDCEVAGYWRHV